MRVVTTCHKAGWEQYGRECWDGLKHWPSSAEFYWYAEGFDVPPYEHGLFGVLPKRCEALPKLEAFKAKHAYYVPPGHTPIHYAGAEIIEFGFSDYGAYADPV